MIKNPYVSQTVWTTFSPLKGVLDYPLLDTILEVPTNPPGRVLLTKCNHIGGLPDEWYNDYYGNLIEINYLFSSFEEAKNYLVSHFERQYNEVKKEEYRLNSVILRLKMGAPYHGY